MVRIRRKIKREGFTLVELMIVIFILTVGILGMMRIFIYSDVLAGVSGSKSAALSEAQSKIEQIRNHTFSSIVGDYNSTGSPGSLFNLVSTDGSGVITVTEFADEADSDLLQIQVDVTWEDKYGRPSTDTLMSLIANRG